MKVTNTLAIEYLKKNKRKNLSAISGIAVATVIIICTLIILFSYQKYAIEVVRGERNYEVEFSNIKYADSKEIEKDKNVKEISVTKDLGVSQENLIGMTDMADLQGSVRSFN